MVIVFQKEWPPRPSHCSSIDLAALSRQSAIPSWLMIKEEYPSTVQQRHQASATTLLLRIHHPWHRFPLEIEVQLFKSRNFAACYHAEANPSNSRLPRVLNHGVLLSRSRAIVPARRFAERRARPSKPLRPSRTCGRYPEFQTLPSLTHHRV